MKFNRNQKLLIEQSVLWAVYYGLTSAFLIAFALALGATNTIIGIAGALPYLAAILAQVPGAKLVEGYSRIHINCVLTFTSRLLWIPIILIPVFFQRHPLITLLAYFFLVQFTEWLTHPTWTSLAGEFVPIKHRGEYFGKRNMMMAIAGLTVSILGAVYLDLFAKSDYTGFSTMFLVGVLFGLWSSYLYVRMKERPYRDKKRHKLIEFFKLKGEFRKLIYIIIFFNFGFMISSPFFIVYMLKNLSLSYTFVMVSFAVAGAVKIFAHKHFGKATDKVGDKAVAIFSIFGTALVPFTYLFITTETIWLIFVAQIISGIFWAGVEISVFNLVLDFSHEHRTIKVAKYVMLTSVPLILAPIVGGLVADRAVFILSGIPIVFAISFLLRAASAVMMFSIKEPRVKTQSKLGDVLHELVAIHPIQGIGHTISGIKGIFRSP
ncbi:MFS transporter [Candidatus Woesearchaeota archaeon]|nr:MFS transporter [Candidatus Woesearchaeota archaeon]MBW2994373.1 MFS transporter [Candidatus Woesearchaeota archaeon]